MWALTVTATNPALYSSFQAFLRRCRRCSIIPSKGGKWSADYCHSDKLIGQSLSTVTLFVFLQPRLAEATKRRHHTPGPCTYSYSCSALFSILRERHWEKTERQRPRFPFLVPSPPPDTSSTSHLFTFRLQQLSGHFQSRGSHATQSDPTGLNPEKQRHSGCASTVVRRDIFLIPDLQTIQSDPKKVCYTGHETHFYLVTQSNPIPTNQLAEPKEVLAIDSNLLTQVTHRTDPL